MHIDAWSRAGGKGVEDRRGRKYYLDCLVRQKSGTVRLLKKLDWEKLMERLLGFLLNKTGHGPTGDRNFLIKFNLFLPSPPGLAAARRRWYFSQKQGGPLVYSSLLLRYSRFCVLLVRFTAALDALLFLFLQARRTKCQRNKDYH